MAKLLLLSSIALLFFLHLGTVKVANAGASNRIAPLQSTIYYLQDYCKLAEDGDFKDEEKENRRHRRSYNNDEFDFSDAIHQTIKDTKRRIKDQVKREQEIGRKWKQVFLDLATSPSVVVKLWRPDSIAEKDSLHQQLHRKLVESADIHQKVSCKLLLRLSKHLNESITAAAVNQKNNIVSSLANSTTLGAVVNFLKLNQKPSLTDYRLRIVSSDPNMTQYWISGRKLKPASNLEQQLPPQLPAAVDLVTNPAMHPKALMKEELELLNETIEEGGKWLLIELETINALTLEDDNELEEDGKTPKTPPKQDNTELVISMFTRSVRSADAASQLSGTTQSSSSGSNSKQTSQNNSTLQQKCPVGTFDCAGDGEQCIPSGLRCNGEDNCGNRLEELLNCGTVNLYYIFEDSGHHHNDFDFESDGFWFAVKILALLFLVCLLMYTASLLCRCCCENRGGSRGGRHQQQIITGRSPLVYHLRSGGAKGSSAGVSEPLISAAAGSRAMMNNGPNRPSSPPPGYYHGSNQLDNQGSTINEHIYVNNHYNSNYGQPQGGTAVHTGVAVPIVSPQNGGRPNASAPAPPSSSYDNFAPSSMYPKIDYPSYGSTQKQ